MPKPVLSRVCRSIAVSSALVLLAASCGSSGRADTAAAPTVDPSASLLPASTPPPATPPGPDAPAATDTGVDAAAESTVVAEPQPVPTAAGSPSDCMSRRQRIAQLLLPLVTQPELFGAQVFAADGELGGIGMLGEPDAGFVAEVAALQQAALFVPVLVASDEEGGSVQRFATLLGPIPSAATTAQSTTPEATRAQWLEYGARLQDQGVDVVFGPVLDVGAAPGIDSRSFSDDPVVVAAYGRAVAEGLLEAGVMPVFKHFPGHGRASADSHLELPITPAIDELRAVDLVPYADLLADAVFGDRAGVMVGHLAVPGLSGEVPTSLSPNTVSGLLRDELGFRGLVFTDAMNMGAIINGYGRLEAIELAFMAGADIAILGSLADLTPTLDHLEQRAELDQGFAATLENRVERVLAAKGHSSVCDGAQ